MFVLKTKNNTEEYNGEVSLINKSDLISIQKENWFFDWNKEYSEEVRHTYKITVKNVTRRKTLGNSRMALDEFASRELLKVYLY